MKYISQEKILIVGLKLDIDKYVQEIIKVHAYIGKEYY